MCECLRAHEHGWIRRKIHRLLCIGINTLFMNLHSDESRNFRGVDLANVYLCDCVDDQN